ncbi:cysteine-rich small domain protein [Solidesulfovibrio carbinoliphilus subsp. oakridgensis]|uniref:Cysteine-rich small domain protein n=1 Tax=Solidesulfovibrio carbinoliphilus subsp. oakridgensis TaxID=694327 RepID=G7QA43_9BACT|nr:cysteine-rich small domain-containing protein [Solidesulfovibrio carbinoliphilus]EHJ47873.1 cysteine-rich small domain protein [Solidesulfovibrio carbinoliphilus subsp. oakridgensis]
MQNSHRFFQNTGCRYFPCHPGADPAAFNCLFCFCPLYFLPDCGGDPVLRQGVKDCTACLRPHRPEGYDAILDRLRREAAARRQDADPAGAPAEVPAEVPKVPQDGSPDAPPDGPPNGKDPEP